MTRTTKILPVPVGPAPTAMRYNPGHYVSLQRIDKDDYTLMAAAYASAPQIKGFVVRWTWRSFESSLDNYILATHELVNTLAWCQARGLKLILMIEHITYGYADNDPQPPYLNNWTGINPSPTDAQGNPTRPDGNAIAIWDPFPLERLKLLLTRVANYFGPHSAFEGITIEETAISIPGTDLYNPPDPKRWVPYSQEIYRDALIAILAHWKLVAPTIRWFFYMNFMPFTTNNVRLGEYLNAVVVASNNCVITGPDAEPNNAALLARTFPIYFNNNDIRPVAAFFSTQVYLSSENYTGAELYDFATLELGAQYLCWVCQGVSNPDWTQIARPQIVAHPSFPNMLENWT
jgi:hypothetical protein